jgi:DNA-binding NtrC family response regulator
MLAAMGDKPTIVVLDYLLSNSSKEKHMDGLSALKQINKTSPETFVIILSAQDNIDVALDTLKEGAYDYLSKSETAFIRLKNMIKNIAETVSQNKEREKEDLITKRINLIVILILITLFILSRIVH